MKAIRLLVIALVGIVFQVNLCYSFHVGSLQRVFLHGKRRIQSDLTTRQNHDQQQLLAVMAPTIMPMEAMPMVSIPKVDYSGFIGRLARQMEKGFDLSNSVFHKFGFEHTAGLSLIVITVIGHLIIFPYRFQAIFNGVRVRKLKPYQKIISKKYEGDLEKTRDALRELSSAAQMTPIKSFIDQFIYLPIFFGLYRMIKNLSIQNKLQEPFLWIPNLQTTVFTLHWMKDLFFNGQLTYKWNVILAYLTLPILSYVVEDFSEKRVKYELSKDDNNNPTTTVSNYKIPVVLVLLKLFFNVSFPTALQLYWLVKDILSTIITLLSIKISRQWKGFPPEVDAFMARLMSENPAENGEPTSISSNPDPAYREEKVLE